MKLFLTGASGLLGNALAASFLDKGWTIHASWHTRKPLLSEPKLHRSDLADVQQLESMLETIQPDLIVNAAALTIPSDCAKNPELSKAINVEMPVALASFSSRNQTRLIHYSTDMVFDGKAGNYQPDSPTNPTNLYGEHKRESEKRVQELYPESCIIRLPLLTGNSPAGTRSVHEALWSEWKRGAITPLFEDEWRSPVSVSNVAEMTHDLIGSPEIQGLFHWAGATYLNRWEMGTLIAEKLDVPKNLLQRSLARDFPQFKDRPLNLTMDSSKLKALVQTDPAPFETQLSEITRPSD